MFVTIRKQRFTGHRKPRSHRKTFEYGLPSGRVLLSMALALLVMGCSSLDKKESLETVSSVGLVKYLGTWKEIYRIPNSFQDGDEPCFNTTATYRLRKDGKIVVRNECMRESGVDVATALAYVVEGSGNAQLKVNFTGIWLLRVLGIGDGNYWILGLGPEKDGRYSWALVGEPGRQYGWILAREKPGTETLARILTLAEEKGYRKEQFQSFERN
ncbi:MAG: lipocalin family protein [Leptospiraceae bacterium]|nr:lipocalin family protein [Leptospiraceae bacterium]